MSNATEQIKILHTWEIPVDQDAPETTQEVINGQTVSVTRQVKKTIPIKMALKQPTRREMRQADMFYGTEFNRFVTLGFLPRSILINNHLDITGGVMSGKERDEVIKLSRKHAELEQDLMRAINQPAEEKKKIEDALASVRVQISNVNAANESVFSQTAETKAQNQLTQWLTLFLVYIDKNGKWVPYFEGEGANYQETFNIKEEFMFQLEEKDDPFYLKVVDKALIYIFYLAKGANKPEHFKLIDDELKKQNDAAVQAKKEAEEAAAKIRADAESAITQDSTPQVTPEVVTTTT